MDSEYVRNPLTGRLIKIGSMTYRKLINEKVIKNKRKDPKIVYSLDEGDDVVSIKKDLRSKISLKKGETLRNGTGKNKGKIIKSFVGGRYKKDPESSDDDDDFENLCKKLDVSFPNKPTKKPTKKSKAAYFEPEEEESEDSDSEKSDESEEEESD